MSKFRGVLLTVGAALFAVVVLGACAPAPGADYDGPLVRKQGATPPAFMRLGAGAPLSLPNPTREAYTIEASELPDLSGSYDGEAEEITAFTYVGPARLDLTPLPDGGYVGRLTYANPHFAWTVFQNSTIDESEYASFEVTVPPYGGVYPDGSVVVPMLLRAGPEQRIWVTPNEWYLMFLKLRPMPSGGYFLDSGFPDRYSPELGTFIDQRPSATPAARLKLSFWPRTR